jgi:hypothetical protein
LLLSPLLCVVPIVDVFLGLIFCVPVALLEFALQLLALSVDDVEIVVSKLAPLLFDLALDLLPVSFNPISIHGNSRRMFANTAGMRCPYKRPGCRAFHKCTHVLSSRGF